MSFQAIPVALEVMRHGGVVVVMDDEDRENEGDLVMAGQCATKEKMSLFIRYTSGIICAPMSQRRANDLKLAPMLAKNEDPKQTAWTTSCDHVRVSTGVSAADRALTISGLASSHNPQEFTRPGHVYPLIAKPKGVLERRGHTEASVDLCRLAGVSEVAAIGELTEDDGTMSRLPQCQQFALKYHLPLITIDALVKFRNSMPSDYVLQTGIPRCIRNERIVFDSIPNAISCLARGGVVVVMDDENRENEGDVIMAAEYATPEQIALFIKHTSGIICVPMEAHRAKELGLKPMVANNQDPKQTAFTVTCDAVGSSTGVSAVDRTLTIHALASTRTRPSAFTRPGHIFPLVARDGGVLVRRGHTEASVDLCKLAGLSGTAVIGEITNPDGTMSRLPECADFAQKHNFPLITIDALARYLNDQKRNSCSPSKITSSTAPTVARVNQFAALTPSLSSASLNDSVTADSLLSVTLSVHDLSGRTNLDFLRSKI